MRLTFYVFCILVVLCGLASAGAPKLMNYQGQLATSGGSPVPDGNYSVTFTVYDAPVAGNIKWTENQNVTTTGGAFAVLLGSVTPINDTVFNALDRYLGITVGADPEMTPRIRLVTAPYSFRVSTVDGAGGGSIFGSLTLPSSTMLGGNVFKNDSLFLHNAGTDNTFLGENAGNLGVAGAANMAGGTRALRNIGIGSNNTGLGADALRSNTDGNNNTAIGSSALAANTAGLDNTATGVIALRFNTTGGSNTATGHGSLHSNTTGNSNTATGAGALFSNTTADKNTAVGTAALILNSTGFQNTATGAHAMMNNTTGFDNTALGYAALQNVTTGSQNTGIGSVALNANTVGIFNTAVGYMALTTNSNGTTNTAVGAEALRLSTTANSNTAVGQGALENTTTGGSNTAMGRAALILNTTGQQNTALGNFALQQNTTGSFNTCIGENSDVTSGNLFNATAIGFGSEVNASDKIRLGNASVSVLECQVGLTVVSDSAAKENFYPVDGEEVLDKLEDLNVQSWNYKGHDPARFRHYGPVAQEFYEAFGDDGVGQVGSPTTINSQDVDGLLLIAVRTLAKKNEALERSAREVKSLKAELDELKATVKALAAMQTSD